jgi:hypothetical protein
VTPHLQQRLPSALTSLAIAAAVGAAVLLALFSLRWPIVHDLPIFLYDGYLIQELGRVPFRDFYDPNTPGTMLLYTWLQQAIDGSWLMARVIDLSLLMVICGLTIAALRSHGVASGVLASACFALAYLAKGPGHSLQREYLSILPLALSTAMVFRADSTRPLSWLSMAAIGLLAGAATSVKPPLLLCWAPLVIMASVHHVAPASSTRAGLRRVVARVLLPMLIGVSLPLVGIVAWLVMIGGLESYLQILANYYPLYIELQGSGALWQSGPLAFLFRYVIKTLELLPTFPFVLVSFIGLGLAWTYKSRPQFLQALVICGLAITALLYVAVSGKFFTYHRVPLFYALALLAGLSVSRSIPRSPGEWSWQSAVLCIAVLAGLPLQVIGSEFIDWRAGNIFDGKNGRVELIADYLSHRTSRSETVLPLDVTSGAIDAMYRNRRPLYGRFIYDLQFHHHVDRPYIQALRDELIAQFRDGEPDIVIQCDDTWLRTDFPQLDAILARDYEVALRQNEVTIFRRRVAAD